MKGYSLERSAERDRFAHELPAELAKLGERENKASGSAGAARHRVWIDTKVALGGGDQTILESVEAGEDNAKDTYNKAL